MTRLQWKQKKYAVASSQYDKLLQLMKDRHGEDSKLLIPVYQECGKISFHVMVFLGGGRGIGRGGNRGEGWNVAKYPLCYDLFLIFLLIVVGGGLEGKGEVWDKGTDG